MAPRHLRTFFEEGRIRERIMLVYFNQLTEIPDKESRRNDSEGKALLEGKIKQLGVKWQEKGLPEESPTLGPLAQNPGRQKDDSLEEFEHSLEDDADEAERKGDKPDYGVKNQA